ncbi:unnamed protein product [Pedinophyceae sp. YPF-701]|nr:unnamed protein product [Pedinophyceae sp. YPF-701]
MRPAGIGRHVAGRPCSNWLAVLQGAQELLIYQVGQTYQHVRLLQTLTLPCSAPRNAAVRHPASVAWSPCGRYLAVCHAAHVEIFVVRGGQLRPVGALSVPFYATSAALRTLRDPAHALLVAVTGAAGTFCLTTALSHASEVRSAPSDAHDARWLPYHLGGVLLAGSACSAAAFSPTGGLLAVAGIEGAVEVWDTAASEARGGATWTVKEWRLVYSDVHDMDTARAMMRVVDLSFSPDERWIAVASWQGTVRLFARGADADACGAVRGGRVYVRRLDAGADGGDVADRLAATSIAGGGGAEQGCHWWAEGVLRDPSEGWRRLQGINWARETLSGDALCPDLQWPCVARLTPEATDLLASGRPVEPPAQPRHAATSGGGWDAQRHKAVFGTVVKKSSLCEQCSGLMEDLGASTSVAWGAAPAPGCGARPVLLASRYGGPLEAYEVAPAQTGALATLRGLSSSWEDLFSCAAATAGGRPGLRQLDMLEVCSKWPLGLPGPAHDQEAVFSSPLHTALSLAHGAERVGERMWAQRLVTGVATCLQATHLSMLTVGEDGIEVVAEPLAEPVQELPLDRSISGMVLLQRRLEEPPAAFPASLARHRVHLWCQWLDTPPYQPRAQDGDRSPVEDVLTLLQSLLHKAWNEGVAVPLPDALGRALSAGDARCCLSASGCVEVRTAARLAGCDAKDLTQHDLWTRVRAAIGPAHVVLTQEGVVWVRARAEGASADAAAWRALGVPLVVLCMSVARDRLGLLCAPGGGLELVEIDLSGGTVVRRRGVDVSACDRDDTRLFLVPGGAAEARDFSFAVVGVRMGARGPLLAVARESGAWGTELAFGEERALHGPGVDEAREVRPLAIHPSGGGVLVELQHAAQPLLGAVDVATGRCVRPP